MASQSCQSRDNQVNHRRLPTHCVKCLVPVSSFCKLGIWRHDISKAAEAELVLNMSVDDALRIQTQDPTLKFHVERECCSCGSINHHCLFPGKGRSHRGQPDKKYIHVRLKNLRQEWRRKIQQFPIIAAPPPMGTSTIDTTDDDLFDIDNSDIGDPIQDVSQLTMLQSVQTDEESRTSTSNSLHPIESSGTDRYLSTRSTLGRCSFQKEFREDKILKVEPKSLDLYLKIGELVLILDSDSRSLLSSVLVLALEEHFKRNRGETRYLQYPTTEVEFQSEYLNPYNSNSLVNNIPIPLVESLQGGKHSYSNFITMIQYISSTADNGKKTRRAVKKRHRTLVHSQKFKDHLTSCSTHLDRNTRNVIVMILLWSDGFDPNRTKTNRGSVWALTATYIFYDCRENKVFMVKTEIISCGRDKDDHSCVFERMARDMGDLKPEEDPSGPSSFKGTSLFFNGEEVRYFPFLLGALMDNPERRWNCGLKMGSAKNHGYFGLSCNFSELHVPFSPCASCRMKIQEYVKAKDWSQPCLSDQECNVCLGLSIGTLTSKGKYKAPVPSAFKTIKESSRDVNVNIPGYSLATQPGFLTTKLLTEGWNFSKKMFVSGEWTASTVKSYLGDMFCVNDYQIQRLLREASEWMNPDLSPVHKENLCHPPGLWKLLEIHELYECLMHQAMNSGKALVKVMHRWTTSNGRSADAIKKAQPNLQKVQRLGLSKFSAMPYKTEKFGGYVGENWKTLLILGPWLYLYLTEAAMSPLTIEVPNENLPFSQFNKAHLRAWLMIHCITFDPSLNKEALKALAKPYFVPQRDRNYPARWTDNQLVAWLSSHGHTEDDIDELVDHDSLVKEVMKLKSEGAPIRSTLAAESSEECGKILRNMYSSFNSYHSSLVSGDIHGNDAENRSQGLARLFLSEYLDLLCLLDGPQKAEEVLFKKPTMYGVLRMTTHFSSIFELSSLDEGGENGEGYVKKMRKFLTHGLKGNWQRPFQQKLHRGTGLSHLRWCIDLLNLESNRGECNQPDESNYDDDVDNQQQEFTKHKNHLTLQDALDEGDCISLVVYANHEGIQFGAIAKKTRKEWDYYRMHPVFSHQDDRGYSYFSLGLDLDKSVPVTHNLNLSIPGFDRYASPALALPIELGTTWVYAIVLPDGRSLQQLSDSGALAFLVV